MYTEQELQWIKEFIDTRFDGVDASDEMIALMEKSGLLTTEQQESVSFVKNVKQSRPKETYYVGELITTDGPIQ